MDFKRKKIGEILVELGAIAPAEINLILAQQDLSDKRFGEVGVSRGILQ